MDCMNERIDECADLIVIDRLFASNINASQRLLVDNVGGTMITDHYNWFLLQTI